MKPSKKSPWYYVGDRDYITPEDITEAIKAGATKDKLYKIVLEAISHKCVEDWSLCAFVALKCKK